MSRTETLKLLLLHHSQDQAEQLVNALKNAGHATRPQLVQNEDELLESVKSGSWDLLVCSEECRGTTFDQVLMHIKRLGKDLPTLVLANQHDAELIADALKMGAQDMINEEDTLHVILAVEREISNLRHRRARRTAEQALKESERRCRLLLDNARDAIAYVHDGMHIYCNQSYVDLFGYESGDDIECLPIIDMVAVKSQDNFRDFLRDFQRGENQNQTLDFHGLKADNAEFNARMNVSNATFDGEPCTQLMIQQKLNTGFDAEELAARVKEATQTDPVTGLPNRQRFIEQLDKLLATAHEAHNTSALLYIEIDDFNKVTGAVGISGIDEALRGCTRLIQANIKPQDTLARFGDDVFALLLAGFDIDKATQFADTLRKILRDALIVAAGKTAQITASIGIATISESSGSEQEILDHAHDVLVQARKKNLEGDFTIAYNPTVAMAGESNSAMAEALMHALEKNTFKLMFQPIIGVRSEGEEFYEVLLRLPDSSGKLLLPEEFMQTAASMKLLEKIDRWVVLNALKVLASSGARSQVSLMINLCGESILDRSMVTWIGTALKASRRAPSQLVFQLNETDVSSYLAQVQTFVNSLHDLGARCGISRFGCALNSVNALKHIDFDLVKLDGSYAQDLSKEENLGNIKKILGDIHALSKKTIVPCVENAQTLQKLWTVGVWYIQGVYLQAPTEQMNYDFSS